jgi:hypothetical protein
MLTLLLWVACASRHRTDTAPVTDTARAETGTPDTAPPDTAPPDTAPPDTAQGDTGEPTDTGRPDTGAAWTPCAGYGEPTGTGRVVDTDLDELSGLAVSRTQPGVLWTHEDSGNPAQLVALDTSGNTLARFDVDAPNVDWEDLAIGRCDADAPDTGAPGDACLWLGDIGSNGARSDLALLRIREPDLATATGGTLHAAVYPVRYPDTPQDAEGLAVLPDGTPLVVTKRADATAGLYTLPSVAGIPVTDLLEHMADVATGAAGEDLSARATAADLSPDGSRLLVRAYLHLREYDVTDLHAPVLLGERPFGLELQGEAVAWDPLAGGYRQVAEGRRPTLFHVPCESTGP